MLLCIVMNEKWTQNCCQNIVPLTSLLRRNFVAVIFILLFGILYLYGTKMDYTEDFYFTAVENVLYWPLMTSKWPRMSSFESRAKRVI